MKTRSTTDSWKLRVTIPTYSGHRNAELATNWGDDFVDPQVPVVIAQSAGVRLYLGTRDMNNEAAPSVQVERRTCGWAILIHPNAGDPVAAFYMTDDGKSFVLPEKYVSHPLMVVDEIPPAIDGL